MDREPTNLLDKVVVVLIAVGGAAMLMGNMVILCNRHYRPIKAKSVPLTLLSSVGGLIWIMAALVVNDHFPRQPNTGLDICLLWTYWLQACFGFTLWLNCLTLHLISLYRIFVCEPVTRVTRRGFYYFLIPLLVPAIGFCIVASAKGQIKFKRESRDCQFRRGTFWAFGLIALLVLYFLVFLGFAFKIRKTVSPLNEYRLIRRGGILSLFLFLLSLVTLGTHTYKKPVGRCLLSAAVASTIFYYFWARNGVVIFNVLFHKEEYLTKFNAELRRSPSHHERKNTELEDNMTIFLIFDRDKCSDAVLRMEDSLKEIRGEVQQERDRIRQLEEEVKLLELTYDAMQQKNSSQGSSIECGHDKC
ncbi:hypothetical protein L7F22_059560 [Adiantum nelumboides]|nr:hypothetical protein [Adiantum nelumboides]